MVPPGLIQSEIKISRHEFWGDGPVTASQQNSHSTWLSGSEERILLECGFSYAAELQVLIEWHHIAAQHLHESRWQWLLD
ncbi:hypothetical protein LMH87_007415 [Akanthomyces muscarius]|uniref:Uncharacterized protein n=1 Tax=Akanthomyces muscarius TaxID=2231603 RepID=A0A9W8QRK3_AKAMU|nr:hypothetical protein LMH87_007415 [Akanthomyces muscarius]KAJ4165800.1 hypothetical protein LMH87_007415 [Akanthomyces muscarius]